MRFAKSKLFPFSLLLGGNPRTSQFFAVEEQLWTEQLKGDLGDIKTRPAALAANSKEIIFQEANILKDLERVRIWIHRK